MGDSIDPDALFDEDMDSDEPSRKVQVVKKLKTVALALGEEKTRTKLVQGYMTEKICTEEQSDEVLRELARTLGEFVDFIGGPDQAAILVPMLDKLCQCDETCVRTDAVRALKKIQAQITPQLEKDQIVPVMKALSESDWFTPRVAACGLHPGAMKVASIDAPLADTIKEQYKKLCNDDTPMVRRAAAAALGEMAAKSGDFENYIMPLVDFFKSDIEDSVRVLLVQSLPIIMHLHPNKVEFAKGVCKEMAQDKAWKVRAAFAKVFAEICQGMAGGQLAVTPEGMVKVVPKDDGAITDDVKKTVDDNLFVCYNDLLQDPELEVRIEASKQCADAGTYVSINTCKAEIFPKVMELINSELPANSAAVIRENLASACMNLAAKGCLGKDGCITLLVPFILGILKNEAEVLTVRLAIARYLGLLAEQIGAAEAVKKQSVVVEEGQPAVSVSIMDAIKSMAEQQESWRLRHAVTCLVPELARTLGASEMKKLLQPLLFDLLGDKMSLIRQQVYYSMYDLVEAEPKEYEAEVIKYLQKFLAEEKTKNSFFKRQVLAEACGELARVVSNPETTLFPLLKTLIDDGETVPNVKMIVASSLCKMKDKVKSDDLQKLLTTLSQDPDPDVSYNAKKGL